MSAALKLASSLLGGKSSDDKCDAKVQEKAAGELYEKIWPILSDKLCNKFEENAENMSIRITEYMIRKMEEKPGIIMPIIEKMLEIMNPITKNTEEEKKNLVELLEQIINKANELKNREEIVKSNTPPNAEPSAPPLPAFSATTPTAPSKPDFDFQKDGIPNTPPVGGTVANIPTNPAALAAGLGAAAANPAALASGLGEAASGLSEAAANPAALAAGLTKGIEIPEIPKIPTNATDLLSMAMSAKKGGSRKKIVKTYKNKLIKKLYNKTRGNPYR